MIFMLSTGNSNETALFSYLFLLDVGILAIVMKKSLWVILEPLTIIATYAVYFLWYGQYYGEENLIVAIFFLSLF